MNYIAVSDAKIYDGTIYTSTGNSDPSREPQNLLSDQGYWETERHSAPSSEQVIIDYNDNIPVNYIELEASSSGEDTFPDSFRLESSIDGKQWKVIHIESASELEDKRYSLFTPLICFRFLKCIVENKENSYGTYSCELGKITTKIHGALSIKASSTEKNNRVNYLLNGSTASFWESKEKDLEGDESVEIDLGQILNVNRIQLGSSEALFPEQFNIDGSADKKVWSPLCSTKNFTADPYTQYIWDVELRPVRYIRMEVKTVPKNNGQFSARIAQIRFFAAPYMRSHTHNIGEITPYASIFQGGIVTLAKDGDDKPGTAVQANDRRLSDATTIFKGIVQLASDGDISHGHAVQASDSRLQSATEEKAGTVRLAYDREEKAGTAVQGSDSRLSLSTEENYGITRLCPNGEYTDSAVVKGNDSRLHRATTDSFGIVKLAPSGSTAGDAVVKGNDPRLRDASTTHKGIVELAENGETRESHVVQSNDDRLKDATTTSKGIVELAEDGENSEGVVIQGSDRRLKDATTSSTGIVELAEDGEDREGVAVQGNDSRLKDATTTDKGILRFAENGETSAYTAVQSNDSRLKNASTTYPGIVELADDGENSEGVAIQGNDRRLKDATTTSKGIVELAEDGESGEGRVVQGNDRRLKDATTTSKGIVEFAEDGENAKDVAVQGNDKRLRDATTTSKGIVELAEDGETLDGVVVQGSDKRLRDATTTSKGIVELAEDGEILDGVAVQGSDKRLKDATTTSKGIIELAEDGETSENVAVRGNDRRLKDATTTSKGIVEFAEDGENRKGVAVQGNDKRLSDPRSPLPHSHDYAPRNHSFDEHTGALSIQGEKHVSLAGITPPSEAASVIHGNNTINADGAIGISGVAGTLAEDSGQSYGVLGHSRHIGIRGQATGGNRLRGCGVLGVSRFGAGGVFSSEHSYSLVADGMGRIEDFDTTVNLKGNGEALLVKGKSDFHGSINLHGNIEKKSPSSIVEMFVVEESEYIDAGDLLVVSPNGGSVLQRSRVEYNSSVIGVVAGNPAFILNNTGTKEKVYPVALSGTVMCKVDARKTPIKPGDLIVTSNTPGCGMVGAITLFKRIGTVIGKALDSLDEGIGVIPVFIMHQ